MSSAPGSSTLQEAIYAWVREDCGVGLKMLLTRQATDALLNRLSGLAGELCTDHRDDSFTPDEAWQDLVEKDDRTSPADYPDMALITFDELRRYMLFTNRGRA